MYTTHPSAEISSFKIRAENLSFSRPVTEACGNDVKGSCPNFLVRKENSVFRKGFVRSILRAIRTTALLCVVLFVWGIFREISAGVHFVGVMLIISAGVVGGCFSALYPFRRGQMRKVRSETMSALSTVCVVAAVVVFTTYANEDPEMAPVAYGFMAIIFACCNARWIFVYLAWAPHRRRQRRQRRRFHGGTS